MGLIIILVCIRTYDSMREPIKKRIEQNASSRLSSPDRDPGYGYGSYYRVIAATVVQRNKL